MASMPAKLILLLAVVAPVCHAAPIVEKMAAGPKLVYRQIGGGYSLAREVGRKDGAFFLCGPTRTDCIGTKEIGWKKPFIIFRSGDLMRVSYSAVDTRTRKGLKVDRYLKAIACSPGTVAWEKLSPTRPLW